MSNDRIAGYLSRLPGEAVPDRPLFRAEDGHAAGLFYGARLSSVFQPVVGSGGAITGHAAYVRVHGDGANELSPWQMFARAADDDELVRMDRLCRTVHAINYFRSAAPDEQLYLAVEARLLASVPDEHGKAFERVLNGFGIETGRVTIVLPETVNANPVLLSHVIANYRYRGYRVAVTYRGGNPDFLGRLEYFRPDIVRLRSSVRGHEQQLAGELRAIHDAGARALVTQLETPSDVAAARYAGADLLQGFALGRPLALYAPADDARLIGSTPLI